MKLIESKAEYIPQEPGLDGIYKQIELAGRTAYKSEDKITPDSAKGFVDRMVKSNHLACLEHGTVYLLFDTYRKEYLDYHGEEYEKNAYSKVRFWCSDIDADDRKYYITTNLRVLVENNWLDDLKYLCEPTEYHEKRYTMRFTCDIGVCRELLRHRKFSFLNESTRYCNYFKDKFNNEITFIKPSWYSQFSKHLLNTEGYRIDGTSDMFTSENDFENILKWCEATYIAAIAAGATPQQARQVLPLATKCDLIMTGFACDWKYFFDLRLYGKTGAPHPDMKELATKAMIAMQDAGIWMDIESKPSKFK